MGFNHETIGPKGERIVPKPRPTAFTSSSGTIYPMTVSSDNERLELDTPQFVPLYSHVSSRIEDQRRSLQVNSLNPTERRNPAMTLSLALLLASKNHSPTAEETQKMTVNNQTAHSLGIILSQDPDKPAADTSIHYLNTPEPIAARDSLWQLLSQQPSVENGQVPLATQLRLSELRSAIVGRGTRGLREYADHLLQARIALSDATARGNSADEAAWDRPVDGNENTYTVAEIYRDLRRLTHNTVYVAMPAELQDPVGSGGGSFES